jgi:signal transduction histidine kinase
MMASNFGFAQQSSTKNANPEVHLQAIDTVRLAEIFASLERVFELEPTNESIAWKNALRLELMEATKSQEALDFITSYAEKLGEKYRNLFRMQEALFWHQLEFDAASRGNMNQRMIRSLNNIGLIFRKTDKYDAAIEAYQQAIALAEKSGETQGIVHALNGLGNIFLELGNLEEAMINFRECLRKEEAAGNLLGIAINLNNIGHVYKEKNDLKHAMEYFMLSLEVNQEIGSQRGIAICYNDIGEIYHMMGDNEKALDFFERSLNINKVIGDLYYLSNNHLKISEILLSQGNFNALMNHLDEALRLSKITNNRSNLMKCYRMKYKLEYAKGNINSAITHLEKAWALRDSILNQDMQRKLLQMQAIFNRERANNQIALLENEKMLAELRLERQKDYTLLVVAGLFLLLVGLGLLTYLLLGKNKAVAALKSTNREVEQARIQLAEYNNQLLIAKQEAELNNKLKSQFLANMSHEIRTPLNSVIGFADLLSEKITDPVKLSYLDNIRSSGRSLLMLIEDILDLSKIEAGMLKPELHSMSLSNLFLEMKRLFELQAYQKNIVLKFDRSPDFPEIVVMHEGSLRQIMVNLIGNALKFTDSGRIVIEASVLCKVDDIYDLKISISDTGLGIAPEDLDHIFDAFYQSQDVAGFSKGTGLGLTITRRLVELLNGTITVSSKQGEGTTFDIVFQKVKTIALRTAFRLPTHGGQHSPVALLSVDNMLRTELDAILVNMGLTCDLFEEPAEIYNQIRNSAYRLIIWDAKMIAETSTASNFEEDTECSHILITNTINNQKTKSRFDKVIKFPEELPALENEIKQMLFGNTPEAPLASDFSLMLDTQIPDETALIAFFKKAIETQLIQDVVNFAKLLKAFGETHGEPHLNKIGIELEQTALAVDIDMMNKLLGEFGKRLKQHQNA